MLHYVVPMLRLQSFKKNKDVEFSRRTQLNIKIAQENQQKYCKRKNSDNNEFGKIAKALQFGKV